MSLDPNIPDSKAKSGYIKPEKSKIRIKIEDKIKAILKKHPFFEALLASIRVCH
jgi:hypothetical protein